MSGISLSFIADKGTSFSEHCSGDKGTRSCAAGLHLDPKEVLMKTVIYASIILVAAVSSVFAQSAAEKTGVNSVMGVAPKTADFVLEAASSDMFEIESSRLALERADDHTKAFAQQMVTDHQKTSEELKGLISSGKIQATVPTAMSSSHQSMLDDLKKLQGDDFVKKYHADQQDVHEDAVDLFKRYGEEGENADLKAWAAKTRPALEHHLQMAKDLNK
ncbi:putative membrane protein [Rhizobium viscosum]|uniref:Membrane protein n=2 Tax=Rhizobium viscosum TaxID=1673 RepID=A0ABR9IZP5_RHIVS|nr:putative membrane protein [Rhizobium viscosum]